MAAHGDRSFHVFLSYNRRDETSVARVAEKLRDAGLSPWMDKWYLKGGGHWQDELVEGIRASSTFAVLVGPHGVGDWSREEINVALGRAVKDRGFRLFLVLLPDLPEPFDPSGLPAFLTTRTWVDLRPGFEDPRTFQSLLDAIRGDSAAPPTAPPPPAPPAGPPRPPTEEERLIRLLRGLRRTKDPRKVPDLFRCLAHPSDAVRRQGKAALDALGWERVLPVVEGLARGGDDEAIGRVLDGLEAFEAHPGVVDVLDRLIPSFQGSLRARAILIWERKRLGLERERIAGLFLRRESDYLIGKVLGQGLFTSVFLAEYRGRNLEVVIRILRPEFARDPRIRALFLDLSRRCLRFKHQSLVQTRDVASFDEQHTHFAVREYVEGATLQKVLETGRTFGPSQVLAILRQVLDALGPLHRDGLPHNGIKPSNIFLCEGDRVVLGDPSLPARESGVYLERLAYDYRYAPPEAIQGGSELRSDFYALGCVAYELLCGEPPFVADDPIDLAGRHRRDPVVPPSSRGRGLLGEAGDAFLGRLLAKSPSGRPARLDEVSRHLDALRASPRLAERSGRTSVPLAASWLAEIEDARSIIPFGPMGPGPLGTGAVPPRDDPGTDPTSQTLPGPPAPPRSARDDPGIVAAVAIAEGMPADVAHPATEAIAAEPQRPSSAEEPWMKFDAPEPGKILFGRYLVEEKLGEGGMGTVWRVRHLELDTVRALKMIVTGIAFDPSVRARFRREARVMARLNHPNAVAVHDARMGADAAFIEMEYVPGLSVNKILRPGVAMPTDWVMRIAEQLCDVLQEAHGLEIVHRDLKPSNLMLVDGLPVGGELLKVLDFGIAKILDPEGGRADEPLTSQGSMPFTAAYASPEQVGGDEVGARSDLYSLGVILYEFLTGHRPFSGRNLIAQHLASPPPPFAARNPAVAVAPGVERIVLRCLAKRPEDRPGSARELWEELRRAAPDSAADAAKSNSLWARLLRRRRPPLAD